MGRSSKILLDIENSDSPTPMESKLLVCQKNEPKSKRIQSQPAKPPQISYCPAPKSQVLGKIKDFLGLMEESNKKLEMDAMKNPKEYDIEAITGDESELLEFDLMLGVADLNTPEAVAAAESAIFTGYQPAVQVDVWSGSDSESAETESESEDNSDEDDDDDAGVSSKKPKRTQGDDGSSGNHKRSKIVEIS